MRKLWDKEKEIELERLRQETERMKMDVQRTRLQLIGEGKLLSEGRSRDTGAFVGPGLCGCDVAANLRLLPKLNERDPDIFFTLLERIAYVRDWPDTDRVLMLQCILTGRAQEAYSDICWEPNGTDFQPGEPPTCRGRVVDSRLGSKKYLAYERRGES